MLMRAGTALLFMALGLFSLLPGITQASVVMTGTRIIYPASAKEKSIQLTNNDDHPNLVQVWVGKESKAANASSADAPFVANPQVFRMEAKAGQMVRLIYTGGSLPQDRETVFYLTFSQVPAVKAKDLSSNKLVVMFSNRLKLFYRPGGLDQMPADLPKNLTATLVAGAVRVDNPTPYYASITKANLMNGASATPLLGSAGSMVSPKSSMQWPLPRGANAAKGGRIEVELINDYGAVVHQELILN